MTKKVFEEWEYEGVEQTFGIKRAQNHPLLTKWLAASHPIDTDIKKRIDYLSNLLLQNADAWNEDELKYCFISPFVAEAQFTTPYYKPFTQRNLSLKFPELELEVGGNVEFMLAQGKQRPQKPFFFLHEYKQERKRNNDPLGQLLISMFVATKLNEKEMPQYGCYVIGRFWFFVVLSRNEYAVSLAHDATQSDDVTKIFNVLLGIKDIAKPLFKQV